MFTQINHKGRRQAIRADTYRMRERWESVQVWASDDCSLFKFWLDEWRKLKPIANCVALQNHSKNELILTLNRKSLRSVVELN